jgi:DNA-binding MarR family transcriptional regulator
MTTDEPLDRTELTFLLGLAFQLVVGEFVSRVEGYDDLRPMHGFVFQALRGAGLTSTELADRLGVTKQAAGQIVDDLEARGYLRREPHPEGGRRRLVVLTAKAEDHLVAAGQVLHALEAELARRLGRRDFAAMRHTLVRLVRDLAGPALPPLRPLW